MSEPTPPAAPAQAATTDRPVKQTERPHPLTPLIRGWVVLLAIVVGVGREFIPDGSDEGAGIFSLGLTWILLGVLGIVILAAVAGFLSWYFTRYVIDDEELRIETGALFKNSKRVPFERVQSVDIIQQFAARIFGLAELRIEVGSGDSTIKLRYLTRAQASSLRDYLLSRAHGDRVRIGEDSSGPAHLLTDLSVADQPLVTVSPQRLVGGFLLSSEFLFSAGVLVVVLVVTFAFGVVGIALASLIPLAIGVVSMISRRVVQMFNFTLAQSSRGVRVTRGLFNLTSQSVPVNRIQGVRILQPILWRRLGWYRIDVNVLGYGNSDGTDNDTAATSVLVPVADQRDIDVTLSRILPGFDLTGVQLRSSPRQARWLRPYDFWTLRYGADDRVVITEHGWLTHVRNLVPHAKTQSVRLSQGPLQRRFGLADVHLDITRGPVTPIAHQLNAADARELTMSQLDRARLARAADRERRPVDLADPAAEHRGQQAVLDRFGLSERNRIGAGGESEVYALGGDRVLRIYRATHEAPAAMIGQLRPLYAAWSGVNAGLQVPQILDSGEIGGRWFSVDRRMSGQNLSGWLATVGADQRQWALLSYLDASTRIQQLPSPVRGPARLLGDDAPRAFSSLSELLTDQLLRILPHSQQRLEHDVPGISLVWDELQDWLTAREGEPRLVHGDFCPPNCYITVLPDGRPVVTGVGDFSPHTLNADPMMDVAGAIMFLELEQYPGAGEDVRWLTDQAYQRFGDDLVQALPMYRLYFGFYFSNAHEFDPVLYGWCQRQLTRDVA
ncbi:MAG TPA: PH domain-containing protein [Microlunatus sp.]|nr:PH domain-containing protein [Microlunatus sp.]